MTKIIRPTPHRFAPQAVQHKQDTHMGADQQDDQASSDIFSNSHPQDCELDEDPLHPDRKLANISGEDKKSVPTSQSNEVDA